MGLGVRRAGLRATIAAAILTAGLAPLAAIFALYLLLLEPRLQREILREHAQLALEMGAVLNRNLFERHGDARAFAQNPAARDPTAWRTPGAGPLVRAMDGYMKVYGVYRVMLLVSPSGEILAINSQDSRGRPLPTAGLYGRSVASEPWFADDAAAVLLAAKDPFAGKVLPPMRVEFIDKLYGSDGFVVPFAAAVRDTQGRTTGVLINFFDFRAVGDLAREMVSQRRRVAPSGQRFQVFDPAGRLVFDSAPQPDDGIEPWVRRLAVSLKPGDAPVSGVMHGEAVAVARAPATLGFPGLGWTVVTRERAADAFGSVSDIRRIVITALILTGLAMLGFGLWFGRRLSTPILQLAGRMRALAVGDTTSPVPHAGREDDIGQMAKAVDGFREAAIDRNRATDQLAEREQETELERRRLSDVVEGLGDAFATVDREWRVTLVNTATERFVGRERAGGLGKPLWDLFPILLGTPLEAALRRVMVTRAPETFEAPAVTRPGNWIEWRVYPTPEGVGVWFRDITDRKHAEAALRESEERRTLAMEVADIGAWDADLVHDVLTWDDRCKALFGLPQDVEPSPAYFESHLHPDDRARVGALIDQALDPAGTGEYQAEFRVIGDDGIERWIAASGRAMFEGGRAVRFVGTAIDITERKRAELHRELLVNELNHRVKNSLATVQAIASQTLRSGADVDEARRSFTARIMALARAHDVLTSRNWEGADLKELILGVVLPYCVDRLERIRVDGPRVRLAPKQALALAMAVHELCTNAAKYGALSVESGRVDVTWRAARGGLHLTWREAGGPPVAPPVKRGFGSRLLETGLAAELGGAVRVCYEPGGVVCTIDAPLAAAAEESG
jgi:PAS domain S-box-containing protein